MSETMIGLGFITRNNFPSLPSLGSASEIVLSREKIHSALLCPQ